MDEEIRLPEGTPAAQTPEPSPEGTPRLWADKYKTPEEMETGYAEAVRKMHEATERASRYESLLASGTPAYAPSGYAPAPSPPTGYEGTDTEALITRGEMDRRLRSLEEQYRLATEQDRWHREFFRKHPDLQSHEDYALSVAGQEWQSALAVNPRLADPMFRSAMMPTILDKAAQRVRERIAAIRSEGKAEAARKQAEVAAGQLPGTPGPVVAPAPKKELTEDELREQAFQEEVQRVKRVHQGLLP